MLGIKELNYKMWQAVDEKSPIFYLKDDVKMEEFYLYEVWLYNGDQTIAKYFLDSKTGIQEKIDELLKGVYKGYEVKSLNQLCAEEEISNGLWKESVVSMFADKVEKILLEYRCANNFELGRDVEEIKEISTYIFDEIMKEWKTNKTVEELAKERESSYDYVTSEIDKMTKEELEKNR